MERKFRIKGNAILFFDKSMVIFRKTKTQSAERVQIYRIVGHERRRLTDKVFKAKNGRLFITIKEDIVTVRRIPLEIEGGDKIIIFIEGKEIR